MLFTDVIAAGVGLLTDRHLSHFKQTVYFHKFTQSVVEKKATGSSMHSNSLDNLKSFAERRYAENGDKKDGVEVSPGGHDGRHKGSYDSDEDGLLSEVA